VAINNFIPEIWSAQVLRTLQKALVFGQAGVVNRDYEGEISGAGDTVRINSVGAVTVGAYTKNTNMSAAETLSDAQTSLLIDQANYFNFQVDDVDKAQQKPKVMSEAMRNAGYGLRDEADQYLSGLYVDATTAIDNAGAAQTLTFDDPTDPLNVYNILVDAGVALDELNVPSEGRFVIMTPAGHGLILKDERFVDVSKAGTDAALRNGQVGQAAGFSILKSNNCTPDTGYHWVAGHPMAWSYAEQVNEVEAYRPELRFADAVKGLHVFGAKVVRPDALVDIFSTV
jgi:N4-gp56 family major capsid protein